MTDSSTIDDAKALLRKEAAARRSALTAATRESGAQSLKSFGLDFLPDRSDATVSGFNRLGDELDPILLLSRLAGEGHSIVLPITPKGRARLTFRCWSPGDVLIEGLYGVREPSEESPLKEPAILLVPLLAFDANGHRLGYGAGYYDRTLTDLRSKGPTTAIGVAFAEQEIDAVPHDQYDQRLDWILTPDGPRKIEA